MASSKPQLGIQSPVHCQLCERDPKISWKCLECDLLMCSACKNNIHTKIKTAGEHRILAIKDIGSSPSSVPSKIDMALVETYQTKLNPVQELAVSSDGSLWISDGHRKKRIRLFTSHTGLQKVRCEGNELKVISCFNTGVFDIAVTPDNDLLIADDESKLKLIKSGTNKVVDSVYDLDPSYPVAIHVTRKNKIIVGTGGGKVVVMDKNGKHEKVYEKGSTKDTLVYPWQITATSNDDIFIVDYKTENNKRVVVLGRENIINTYFGHSVINTEDRPFYPHDLTTTPSDNVIVADGCNFLHILNSFGYLVTYVNIEDKGVRFPYCIGLATEEQSCMLYIGTFEKIHKLNLIGC
ncbi:uncharacterized protein LOC134681527 [Mytilus trossulus]|uniref:uncharacterized protein LOC134681527 n=1 Tax=Mytilus trossulus TaxID=6551 RepID=UPI003006BD1E